MKKVLCKDSVERKSCAIALSFASATLLSLEALHPGSCAWMDLNPEQSFALSATLATISIFLGSLILAKLIAESKTK